MSQTYGSQYMSLLQIKEAFDIVIHCNHYNEVVHCKNLVICCNKGHRKWVGSGSQTCAMFVTISWMWIQESTILLALHEINDMQQCVWSCEQSGLTRNELDDRWKLGGAWEFSGEEGVDDHIEVWISE